MVFLSASEFDRLFKVLCKALSPEGKLPRGDKALFAALDKKINESDRVQSHITAYNALHKTNKKTNPRHLADLRREVKKDKDVVLKLDSIYEHIYFLAVGFGDKDKFFDENSISERTITFKGLYFSGKQRKVDEFLLQLDLTFEKKMLARELGYHDILKPDNIALKGSAKYAGKCWLVHVWHEEIYLNINIPFVHKNEIRVLDEEFLNAIVDGVSSDGYPIAFECVLVKMTDSQPGVQPGEADAVEKDKRLKDCILNARRYLNLRRINFHIDLEDHGKEKAIDELQFENIGIGAIGPMSDKTYRILAYKPGNTFIRSKLRIEEDYTGSISMPGKEPLQCFLSMVNDIHRQLLVSAYENRGKTLFTFTAIKIISISDNHTIFHGGYCTTGRESKKNTPIGSRFVMIIDDSDFEAQVLEMADFEKSLYGKDVAGEKERILFKELDRMYGLSKNLSQS